MYWTLVSFDFYGHRCMFIDRCIGTGIYHIRLPFLPPAPVFLKGVEAGSLSFVLLISSCFLIFLSFLVLPLFLFGGEGRKGKEKGKTKGGRRGIREGGRAKG